MSDRRKFLEEFGPLLTEALARLVLAEINILRAKAGLAPRTFVQLVTGIKQILDTLPDYEGMDEFLFTNNGEKNDE